MASELKDQINSNINSAKFHRPFGRVNRIHKVLGGGKLGNVLLWREKKASAMSLTVATVTWVLFEWMECHLLTVVCVLIFIYMVAVCVYNNVAALSYRCSPRTIPKVRFSEDAVLQAASEANRLSDTLYDISSCRDVNKFFKIIGCLLILSVVGEWCSFVTLLYFGFVLAFTLPVLYDAYEDEVDWFLYKANVEMEKHSMQISQKLKTEMKEQYSLTRVKMQRRCKLLGDKANDKVNVFVGATFEGLNDGFQL